MENNKKRLINCCLLICAIIPFFGNAQTVDRKDYLGIEITSNMLKLDPRESYDNNQILTNMISFPLGIGVISRFSLTKRLKFETGLRYTTISAKSRITFYDSSISSYDIEEDFYSKLRLSKLSIPIRFNYNIGLSEKLSLSPFIELVNSLKLKSYDYGSGQIDNQCIDNKFVYITTIRIRETLGDEIYIGISLNKQIRNDELLCFSFKYALVKLKAYYYVNTDPFIGDYSYNYDVNNYFSVGISYLFNY